MGLFDPAWKKKKNVSAKELQAAKKAFEKMDNEQLVDSILSVKDPQVALRALKQLNGGGDLRKVAEETEFWEVRWKVLQHFARYRVDTLFDIISSEDTDEKLREDALRAGRESEKLANYIEHNKDKLKAKPGYGSDELLKYATEKKKESFSNRDIVCRNCGSSISHVHWTNRYKCNGQYMSEAFNLYVCEKCCRFWKDDEVEARVVEVSDKPYDNRFGKCVYACPVCMRLRSVRLTAALANGLGEFDRECGCSVPSDIYPSAVPVKHISVNSLDPRLEEAISEWVKAQHDTTDQ